MAKVIFGFLCVLSINLVNCQTVPSCPDVNNMRARCVDLENECLILYNAANKNKNNPKFAKTLKQLQCGSTDEENFRVCCPVDWIPKVPSTRINPPVTKPPVTKRPVPPENCESLNSRLLPDRRCVNLLKCPSLYKKATERSQDQVVRDEMFSIHCGWADIEQQQPLVCCPLESIATQTNQPSDVLPQGDAPSSQESEDLVDNLPSPPECGVSKLDFPRVVRGRNAKLDMFPWMALLGYSRFSDIEWKCGGSLISTRHVLTAAHCIFGNEKSLSLVRLGELDLASDDDGATPIDIPIKKKFIHEEFDPEINENDIGILTLAEEVQYTKLIKPICMPMEERLRSNSFEDYRPFLAGWGQIKYAGYSASHLQYIQIPVASTAECNEIYKKDDEDFKLLDNRSLCAGYKKGGMDSCSGDSGGPLMQPDTHPKTRKTYTYQTGIISYGKSCGAPGYLGIYVRVSEYIPWIVKQTTGKIVD